MPLVDFAILTGLVEELEAVLRALPDYEEQSENADVWYRARVRANNGENYEVVAAFQTGMGPLAAHDLTSKVIERWDPAYIILVGIAGSFDKEVKLGDVIVSQQIFHYDLGKITAEGIKYRPEGYPCSAVLIRQAESFRLDQKSISAWLKAVKASVKKEVAQAISQDPVTPSPQQNYSPSIHFGTLASGSLVIADKAKQEELLLLHGKIIGTEMEGAGVLHATFSREVPTPALVVKGISDAADKDKNSVDATRIWRELAKEVPVRFVIGMIRRGTLRPLRTDQFHLNPKMGSVDDVRQVIQRVSAPGVHYICFPHLVIPKGPLTGIRVEVEASGNDGPLDFSDLVVRYEDRQGKLISESVNKPPYAIQVDLPP